LLFLTFLYIFFRIITYQASFKPNLIHYIIASINASGTIHTFHLRSIPNIDPRRAHTYTLKTVDAIAQFSLLPLSKFSAWLSSHMIIGDHHRLLIEQYSLQPTIRTYDRTGLVS